VAVPKGATASLPEALAALHALVGAPDDRQLEHYASLSGHRLAHSSANNVRHGRGRPRLETVEAFVAGCLTFAQTRKPPVKVPAEYSDMKMWQVRYEYFTEVTAAARKVQTPDRLVLSTQLPRLRNSPALLLNPQTGVVEFMGRVDELADLLTWCEDDSAGRLRLITGPGGIGKTRLALQLTEKLKELQWTCEWVGDGQEAHVLAAVRAVNPGPVLLVADYAETRIGLEQLLRSVVADSGKIRLLLLARSAGQWWEQLAAGEGAIRDLIVQEGPDGVPLGEVLDDTVSDEDQVLRAIPVFAARLGVSPPEYVAVATRPRRARVLELHAAALVAVLEWIWAPKSEPRVELGGVLNELLQHEERFWLRSALAQGLIYGSTEITPTTLRQAVAAGCLLGAADHKEAVALLRRIPAVPQSLMPALAVWLRQLYPPERDSSEWLGLIQPDRLAERLVISQLGSSEELAQACLSDLGERQARQALLLLGRAAIEDDIAERLLRQLIPLVAQVIEDIDAPLETLVSIANAIPYPSMVLGQAHAAITSRILDTPAAREHPSEYARWLTAQGLALTQLSRPWDALPVTEQAVGLYRQLISVNPGRYKSDLAGSLANLGIAFSEIGRAADALAATQEALTLYRNLAKDHPDRYRPELAVTLTNLGARFSDLGRHAEGLTVTQDAANLLHNLAGFDPDRYKSELAATLTNLGNRFSDVGHHAEALMVTQEATKLYRELASANPDRHRPDHAAALASLGARFSEMGRQAEALVASQDAASLLQSGAAADPDRYRPSIARILVGLGGQFLALGHPAEALSAGQEALGIYRGLAVVNPDWYRPSVAAALATIGGIFSVLQCPAEAIAATEEAVGLYRQLTADNPERYRSSLAAALAKLGDIFSVLRYPPEAIAATEEAVHLYRQLTADNPDRYQSDLTLHLMVLGARLSQSSRPAEALSAEREAISLYRELATENPSWYRPNLALGLMILGAQLSQLHRPVEALRPELEAINLYRELAADNPERYKASLAASLTSLGFRLSELGRPADALAATREAVVVYLEQDEKEQQRHSFLTAPVANSEPEAELSGNPAVQNAMALYQRLPEALTFYRELAADDYGYRPDLALSLIGLVTHLSETGGQDAALSAVQESVSLYRGLVENDPDWYQPNLALALMILGALHSELGHLTEALSAEQEAICLYRELAADNPNRYRSILAASLNSLGFRLSELGFSSQALEVTREATRLYHEQATARRPHPNQSLVVSSPTSGTETPGLTDPGKDLAAAQEAVRLYRTLAAINPHQYQPSLADSLERLGIQLLRAELLKTALSVQREAVSIYQELCAINPKKYQSSLVGALTRLASTLTELERDT
jgi:hypothetical protein